MDLDDALLARLETLAGLRCAPDERDALRRDLQVVVSFVDRLAPLAAAAPPEADDPASPSARDDAPHKPLALDTALADAPARVGDAALCPPPRREA